MNVTIWVSRYLKYLTLSNKILSGPSWYIRAKPQHSINLHALVTLEGCSQKQLLALQKNIEMRRECLI